MDPKLGDKFAEPAFIFKGASESASPRWWLETMIETIPGPDSAQAGSAVRHVRV
jgi:hypothetical protein